jgi:predicted amidohydrolase YtcJ
MPHLKRQHYVHAIALTSAPLQQSKLTAMRYHESFPLPGGPMQFSSPRRWLIVALAFVLHSSIGIGQPALPDLVLFNGKIFTSNARQLYAEALAIRGDRIVAVGSSTEILALSGMGTKRIDLGGRTAVPGFNDAHDHLSVEPDTYELPLKGIDPSWQEVTEALSAAVPRTPKETWISADFGMTILDDPNATRAALDVIAPETPVRLADWTGHASLLNTAAMVRLGIQQHEEGPGLRKHEEDPGIQEDEPNPEGGLYVRDKTGKLTGMVMEFANFGMGRRLTDLVSNDDATRQLHDFFARAAKLGITSVQDMSTPIPAPHIIDLLKGEPPPIRVRVIWFGLTNEHGRLVKDGRGLPLHPAPLVTVSGTKWILDGTPMEHSAAMREPYTDRPEASGTLDFQEKEMEAMLRESLEDNDQLMVHVVGDRAVESFLNAMEATGGERVWAARRVRLEHSDGLMPDLIPRARRLGVIVVQNPTHFTFGKIMVKLYGEKRAMELQPLRTLLDAGIPVALGSDGPNNPFLNIMLATTYERNPAEALTREQAVVAYTLTAAYAEFAEKDKGSLEPGKLADLAVLSQDIFTVPDRDLPKTESLLTLVGGKVAYDAKALGVQ